MVEMLILLTVVLMVEMKVD
jgi:hypothetical protein